MNSHILTYADTLGFMKNRDRQVVSTEDYQLFMKIKEENKGKKVVCTHSGAFHADEVLATMMTKYLDEFKDAWIIRTRNYDIHKETDIVLDVGGIYDANTNRFDHHMKEFTEVFDDVLKIKMSSAGLLYKYYGKRVLENLLKAMDCYEDNEKNIEKIYNKIYVNFIAAVDGGDNGINRYPDDAIPRYLNTTSYASRVSRLNPEWNEANPDQSARFKLAQDVAEDEFISQLKYVAKSYFPAYSIVKSAVDKRYEFHDSGKIIVLDTSCPWKEMLTTIEEEMEIQGQILFALYKSGESDFRVQTIPLTPGNFKFRQGIHQEWRGLEKEKLASLSGIDDINFVHTSGFIGGAKSFESALKMAIFSLN